MGGLLNVHCRRCGAVSDQIDGVTMLGYNPRCDRCGRTRHVSLKALYDTAPEWFVPGHSEPSEQREARIPDVAGKCRCGGRFFETAPVRCLKCRTTEVDTESIGFVD